MTACQNPQVFKQAAYQDMKSIVKKSLLAAMDTKVKGYIHSPFTPFSVAFYMEEQVKAFVRNCARGNSTILHLDATGSIISRISAEGPPYYYCLLLAELNMPVLDLLSRSHAAFRICGAIQEFLSECRSFSPGSILQPSLIVTDFSLALIYAVLKAFNKMSLISYLNCSFENSEWDGK